MGEGAAGAAPGHGLRCIGCSSEPMLHTITGFGVDGGDRMSIDFRRDLVRRCHNYGSDPDA